MNYLIKYTQYSCAGTVLCSGTMRVKNKPNEFVAKASLEDYLKRKHPDAGNLFVHDCKEDWAGRFSDIFPWFK